MKLKAVGPIILCLFSLCATAAANGLDYWLTTADRVVLLKRQPGSQFEKRTSTSTRISVDAAQRFQTMDGFGFTMTGGSAYVINRMPAADRKRLLRELFGSGPGSIGVSYLRLTVGASDLDFEPFSYDDLPAGTTDPELLQFTIAKDLENLIPVLREILRINPRIKFLASPWSPPPWMKDNGSFVGGRLQSRFYGTYARYLVRYIVEMKRHGIKLDALTPQNEPLHPGNNPSMLMPADEQTTFIRDHLGPALASAKLATKIIVYDHNCDRPDYPISVLNDPVARQYIDGSAFHLYAGDIGCLSVVRNAHPDKNVYFTEQYTSSTGNFGGDFKWHLKNLVIGAPRNWSKTVLEWNLASDFEFRPFTKGGCSVCRGGLRIEGAKVEREVAYYIIAQSSKFVPPGSVRIASNNVAGLDNVAYLTPRGKIVLVVLNEGGTPRSFDIAFNNKLAAVTLPAGSAGTFIWKE